VSPVKYELDFYIPEYAILHSDCRENLRSYMDLFPSSGRGGDSVGFLRNI
jgi:hypothetical protein